MNNDSAQNAPTRLTSLDAMRGFTIAAMILVNFPGNDEHVFAPLRHTVWNGLTPTDLIAPILSFYRRHLDCAGVFKAIGEGFKKRIV